MGLQSLVGDLGDANEEEEVEDDGVPKGPKVCQLRAERQRASHREAKTQPKAEGQEGQDSALALPDGIKEYTESREVDREDLKDLEAFDYKGYWCYEKEVLYVLGITFCPEKKQFFIF